MSIHRAKPTTPKSLRIPSKVSYYKAPYGDVYGEFSDCRILGYDAVLDITPIEDGEAVDITGNPLGVGMLVVHISGLNQFGEKESTPAYITRLGRVRERWDVRDDVFDKLLDSKHGDQISFWSTADGYLALDSLFRWAGFNNPFVPDELCKFLESYHNRFKGWYDDQHQRAIRILCESSVGLTNLSGGAVNGAVLRRNGRWGYIWEPAHKYENDFFHEQRTATASGLCGPDLKDAINRRLAIHGRLAGDCQDVYLDSL